ncbi:radical SAM protein [Pseudothermotoga hypogea DSM 11164 = NBRC 106472]|uniref:Radical SAM protein n=1 Tax=Pseudothermotoga hypogea DSM 11164 = NBRC 106472 TaxID=1123384 RepID=A0A0X1KSH8_9THEM|nr:radical SAM protein [Pseudothermotoga hypogea]AJC74232.1 radical SAM protein [Pseudothermotoga hypogea DSM 11164 = NBRC 106472]
MVREVLVQKLVTKTKIPIARYVVNPYIGCGHGCRYCYAQFIGPFKNTAGVWGRDVFVKTNAPEIFERELYKLKGSILFSSICDPYQPIEKKYQLTRTLLKIALGRFRSVHILTKSSLILRDLDILQNKDVSVTITITTDDELVRRILEPNAAPIDERIETIRKLRESNVDVSAFVGPVLPMNPERLARLLSKHVGRIFVDRLNYPWLVEDIYRKNGWTEWLRDEKFHEVVAVFKKFLDVD